MSWQYGDDEYDEDDFDDWCNENEYDEWEEELKARWEEEWEEWCDGFWATPRLSDGSTHDFEEEKMKSIDQRIVDLIHVLDELTADFPSTDGMDTNEAFGMYDGRLMAIRDTWVELKLLLGILGEQDSSEGN